VTFAHVSKLVDEIVTVTDEDISRALLMLLERGKLVVEPAGGVGVAALLAGAVEVEPPVVVVLSGGNIDPMLMLRVIEHGLAAAGRYLTLNVRCGDRPGHLARLLTQIAGHGANVVDVAHSRQDPRLRLGEVEVSLSVETRGAEHSDRLVTALRGAGYTVRF
jgi:threonine dehydratase